MINTIDFCCLLRTVTEIDASIVCAVLCSDEEVCIKSARYLMRDQIMSDSSRMFGLLSNLCQSPVSWYTSGPAQKHVLRQIKAMDARNGAPGDRDVDTQVERDDREAAPGSGGLDVCILMLYGHILFTSTSYAYAISTFHLAVRFPQKAKSDCLFSSSLQIIFFELDPYSLRMPW